MSNQKVFIHTQTYVDVGLQVVDKIIVLEILDRKVQRERERERETTIKNKKNINM